MLQRANDESRKPFKKLLSEHSSVLQSFAECRVEIDAARLIVLNAAITIDDFGAKGAVKEIAEAKTLAPKTALAVIDRAIQLYGGVGVSQDTPLARMWSHIRIYRIIDGPDEVHRYQMGRNENRRNKDVTAELQRQKNVTAELFKRYGVSSKGIMASKM
jgi:acyl-CoA dehydrogenase